MADINLEYQKPPAPVSDAIIITNFSDGGVTVCVPLYRPKEYPLAKTLGIVLPAIVFTGLALGIPWARGMPPSRSIPWAIKLFVQRMPMVWQVLSRPSWSFLILLVPLLWLLLRHLTRRSRIEQTVIGISPTAVFVEFPGLFRRRKLHLSRKRLTGIEIGKYYRDEAWTDRGRFIVMKFSNRWPIHLCYGRTDGELQFIADVLNKAMFAGG